MSRNRDYAESLESATKAYWFSSSAVHAHNRGDLGWFGKADGAFCPTELAALAARSLRALARNPLHHKVGFAALRELKRHGLRTGERLGLTHKPDDDPGPRCA